MWLWGAAADILCSSLSWMLSSLLVFVYLFVSSDYFLQLFVITCRWVCVFCYELHINVDAEAVSRLTHGVAQVCLSCVCD